MLEQLNVNGLSPRQSEIVRQVLAAALAAADPRRAVSQSLSLSDDILNAAGKCFLLRNFKRIRLVGIGKAALAMAQGALDVLGSRVTDGLLITKHSESHGDFFSQNIRVLQGGHPVPTIGSENATRALEEMLKDSTADDLVLCLISGGGSALMTLPADGIGLDDLQHLTRLLLACGANIHEMNTLRKHLDRVKGGGLARMASPAQLVTFILSDVIGSPLDVIASGPTVADPTTYTIGLQILDKYHLRDRVPQGVLSILVRGACGELAETLKPGNLLLLRTLTQLVGSNPQAALAGLACAEKEGMHSLLLTTFLQGEASQAGIFLANLIQQIDASGQPLLRPACIAVGGETTVTLRGKGLGGRNQELALGAAFLLDGLPDVALVTLGTDGEDGPTDAAGAATTGNTLARARSLGLDPLVFLQNNDADCFFNALGDLIVTGPTGTNVNDLVFLFAF
jgi:glycerate 2-kinase